MTIDDKDMINSILESVSRIDYIKPEDIPNIDLYMDNLYGRTARFFQTLRRRQDSHQDYDQQLCKE